MNFNLCCVSEQVTDADKEHLATFASGIYSLIVLELR